jgi:hypothetical protein
MSSSATASDKLISAFKTTAASIGSKASKSEVDFAELRAASIAYNAQLQAALDMLTDELLEESKETVVTTYTGLLKTIESSIQELEADSKAGLMTRLSYVTAVTRKSKEDRFSEKINKLEKLRERMNLARYIGKAAVRITEGLSPED